EVAGAEIIFLAALGDDVDLGAAVVAELRRIAVAQNLDFGDGVLVDRQADFVRAARLAGVQAVNRGDSGTAALAVDVWQVGAEAVTHTFGVVNVGDSGQQRQE